MLSRRLPSRRPAGFTLVELLIVMAIIAILTSIVLSVYAVARRTARERSARNGLRLICVALDNYRMDFNHYPGETDFVDSSGNFYTDQTGFTAPDPLPNGSETLAAFLCQRFTVGQRTCGPYLDLSKVNLLKPLRQSIQPPDPAAPASPTARPVVVSPLFDQVKYNQVKASNPTYGLYVYKCWREFDLVRKTTNATDRAALEEAMRLRPRPEGYMVIDPGWDGLLGGTFPEPLSNGADNYLKLVPDTGTKYTADNMSSADQ